MNETGQSTSTLALALGFVGAGVLVLAHIGARIMIEAQPVIQALSAS
jgi:hypothetical protein